MIKVIAFDFVGVLVREKDIKLSAIEDKLERMFGPNLNDYDYIMKARNLIDTDSIIIKTTEDIINKLYEVKDKEIFNKIKEKYPGVKIVIATNHISFIRNFVEDYLNIENLDDLVVSAEIHKIKPNIDFYQYLLDKYNILPNELLFLDDNAENVKGANKIGVSTIKVEKNTDLFKEICERIG